MREHGEYVNRWGNLTLLGGGKIAASCAQLDQIR
jgi:hypothetical protein